MPINVLQRVNKDKNYLVKKLYKKLTLKVIMFFKKMKFMKD